MTPADLPLSRTKLLAFLKAAYTDVGDVDNLYRYSYASGSNNLASRVIVGIFSGDFDERDAERDPSKEIALEIMSRMQNPVPDKYMPKSSKTAPTGSADAEPRSPTMPRGNAEATR
jgi:hypothetical protein